MERLNATRVLASKRLRTAAIKYGVISPESIIETYIEDLYQYVEAHLDPDCDNIVDPTTPARLTARAYEDLIYDRARWPSSAGRDVKVLACPDCIDSFGTLADVVAPHLEVLNWTERALHATSELNQLLDPTTAARARELGVGWVRRLLGDGLLLLAELDLPGTHERLDAAPPSLRDHFEKAHAELTAAIGADDLALRPPTAASATTPGENTEELSRVYLLVPQQVDLEFTISEAAASAVLSRAFTAAAVLYAPIDYAGTRCAVISVPVGSPLRHEGPLLEVGPRLSGFHPDVVRAALSHYVPTTGHTPAQARRSAEEFTVAFAAATAPHTEPATVNVAHLA